MNITNIVALLGGVALFLFGMSIMGDSLKKVAGNKLELVLYRLSSTPIKGILLGTGVTAVIQSSSATSVMVVGFVNSGMMKVDQAIGIIMGAILGTSVTGWILCLNSLGGSGASIAQYFSTAMITGVVAVIGIVMRMSSKKASTKHIGEIMLGFAVLMYGMSAMSGAVSPLRESPEFISLLTKFSNPIIGIIVGLVFTSILQSASAAVGILQALAVTGAITFDIAFPILMGIGIGASVPVLLSALGASVNGKRTAFIYLIIDVLGAVICGSLFYLINAFVHFSFMGSVMGMVGIAFTNTAYRFVTVVVLTPAIKLLEKVICKMLPDDPEALEEQADMDRLESRFIAHPALAIEQVRLVITSMADKTKQNLTDAISIRKDFNMKGLKKVIDLEGIIDRYEDKLGSYLVQVTSQRLNSDQTKQVTEFLHSLTDFERISDHSLHIGRAAQEIYEKKIVLSNAAKQELNILEGAVSEIVDLTVKAFIENDKELATHVEPIEEVIDGICDAMKFHHIDRIKTNECTLLNGFVFNDLLNCYERIADHCSNIAVAIIETQYEQFNAHEYLNEVKDHRSEEFMALYESYSEKYSLPE
ncbi:MAG: Na/Pi cotransporter family protein [Firmicutes bacterium]|nr:Na/Pi cotransporter family protein [Bacillota bacterium]